MSTTNRPTRSDDDNEYLRMAAEEWEEEEALTRRLEAEIGPRGARPGDPWSAPRDPHEDQAQALAQEIARPHLTIDLDQAILDESQGS